MSPLVCLLLAGQVGANHAERAPIVPHVGLSVGAYAERLEVGAQRETRGLLHSGIALGLDYRLLELEGVGRLEGVSTLELFTVFERGQFPLRLAQQGRLSVPITSWFSVFGGLGAGFAVNLSDPTFSFFELGLPLGVRLGPVDVAYLPRLTVPLAATEDEVFGGTRTQAVATRISPLMVEVRYRFEGLGF